jgi:hypothetical protein
LRTVKEYALDAWAQEQDKRRSTETKKRKRKAKKIEEAIEEILPKDSLSYQFMRNLEAADFGVVVSVLDGSEPLRFTFNDEGDLVLIGKGSEDDQETVSLPIENASDLGRMLERFEPEPANNDS